MKCRLRAIVASFVATIALLSAGPGSPLPRADIVEGPAPGGEVTVNCRDWDARAIDISNPFDEIRVLSAAEFADAVQTKAFWSLPGASKLDSCDIGVVTLYAMRRDSWAARVGFANGDLLFQLNGTRVERRADFERATLEVGNLAEQTAIILRNNKVLRLIFRPAPLANER